MSRVSLKDLPDLLGTPEPFSGLGWDFPFIQLTRDFPIGIPLRTKLPHPINDNHFSFVEADSGIPPDFAEAQLGTPL